MVTEWRSRENRSTRGLLLYSRSPCRGPSIRAIALWQHRVNALVTVDKLRDPHIDHEARKHIGIRGGEAAAPADQLRHLAPRILRGVGEMLVERHRHAGGRRLGRRAGGVQG